LPFDRDKAFRLRRIAYHPGTSNIAHALHLPGGWYNLYLLTELTSAEFERCIADSSINPDMDATEIADLIGSIKAARNAENAAVHGVVYEHFDEGDEVALRIIDDIDAFEAAVEALDAILLSRWPRDEESPWPGDDEMVKRAQDMKNCLTASLATLRAMDHETVGGYQLHRALQRRQHKDMASFARRMAAEVAEAHGGSGEDSAS